MNTHQILSHSVELWPKVLCRNSIDEIYSAMSSGNKDTPKYLKIKATTYFVQIMSYKMFDTNDIKKNIKARVIISDGISHIIALISDNIFN